MSRSVSALLAFCTLLFAAGCGGNIDDSQAQEQDAIKPRFCQTNHDCGSLEFCDTEASGGCGTKGICTSRGVNLFCSNLYVGVCGCDGKTYANACYAHKAGASIAHKGVCACDFTSSPIDGDTLAEQPFMDQTQSDFYTFTGNGTVNNNSGTFTWTFEPPCLRSTPRCLIAIRQERGTFTTSGSTISLSYDNGNSAVFNAQRDCHNALQLVGTDHGQAMTLVISTIIP